MNQLSKKSKEKDIKTGTLRGGQENEEEISRLLAVDLEKAIETVQSFLLDPIFVLVKMQKLMLIWTTNYTTNEFSSYNSYKSKSKLTRLKQSFQTTVINIILKSEKEKISLKETFLIGLGFMLATISLLGQSRSTSFEPFDVFKLDALESISKEPVIKKFFSEQTSNENQIVIKCSDGNQLLFPKRKLSARELEQNQKEFERLVGNSKYRLKSYQNSIYEEETETNRQVEINTNEISGETQKNFREEKVQREKKKRENQVQNFSKFRKENDSSDENAQMIDQIGLKPRIRIKND